MLKEIANTIYQDSELEAENYRQSPAGKKLDLKVIIICITTAISLTLIKYFSNYNILIDSVDFFNHEIALRLHELFFNGPDAQFMRLTNWAVITIVGYFLLPLIAVKLIFKESLQNYGLTFKNAIKDYRIYLIMIAFMIPLVLAISFNPSFQAKYPFYQIAPNQPLTPQFFLWEIEYLIQFFAVEFFFRGFLLHGLKHRFGYYAVFIMTIPYCMIHFGKPMAETLAAIVAGVVLGTLSLKSKNIYLGFLIHISVAITMDVCALWQKGVLHF
jgi:membrane protease YdiL (CAAX protease family)